MYTLDPGLRLEIESESGAESEAESEDSSEKEFEDSSSEGSGYDYLEEDSIIRVPTQFDYASISTRQCSYFCLEAIKNKDKFYELHKQGLARQFKTLYINCLIKTSLKKRNSKDRPDVETLFHPNVLQDRKVKFHKVVRRPEKICLQNEEMMSRSYPNYIDVDMAKLDFDTMGPIDLYKIIKGLELKEYVAINRSVMSFAIVRYSEDSYLILDSHFETISIIGVYDVMRYILEGNGYSLITVMYDQSTHDKQSKNAQ